MNTEVREPSAKYLSSAGFKQTEIGLIPSDWSVASLRDVTDAARPISYGIVQTGPNLANGVPCIRVVDIDNGTLNTSGLIHTSEAISAAYKRTVLRAGDLVMPLRGKVGDVAEVGVTLQGANLTRGVALLSIRTGIVGSYCRHALAWPTTRRRLEQSMNGSALQEIPIAALRSFQIALPREEREQRAIATALSDVDALIAGLERLIAKKRDIKQATMQQLLTGQTRLPGFSGEWGCKRLGELAEMGSGGTPPAGNSGYYGGNIPWVAISDMTQAGKFIERTERSLSDAGLANSAAQLFPAGTVLYAMYASLGECSIACMDLCTSQAILGIRPRAGLIRDFLYYVLTSRRELVKTLGQQGTQSNLNKGIVQGFEILLPSAEEQTAIAKVLSDIDADIEALQVRLAKTRAIKQGMMQELLTGRTRLV